jgi:hypothetical protein
MSSMNVYRAKKITAALASMPDKIAKYEQVRNYVNYDSI